MQLGVLRKIAKRENDIRLYADELGKGLAGELDFTLEAANASEFRVPGIKFFLFVLIKHVVKSQIFMRSASSDIKVAFVSFNFDAHYLSMHAYLACAVKVQML